MFFVLVYFILLYYFPTPMMNEEILPGRFEPRNHPGFILDTPGCKIPKLDPFDPSVKRLIKIKKPYECKGDPVFIMTRPNSTVILNETVLEKHYNITADNVSCSYRAIHLTKENNTNENNFKYGNCTELRFGVPLAEEFIRVHCVLGETNFTQFIPLVPIKETVEENASTHQTNNADKLNVILIGIDSISKLNFLRHFKKTHNFLKYNLSAFDMKGYTKVADNTFPNLVPLLTGHFVDYYWNESMEHKMYFDDLDFIWKQYASRGYRTFYAEDAPSTGTFNYLKKGFKNPPTDYYFRPLALAVSDFRRKTNGSYYCLNDELQVNLILHYLRDFIETMNERPYFAFAMVSTLTHDYLNWAGYMDEPTYDLLNNLWTNGITNQSMVVVFSDHGIRFGKIREKYIGKIEERMPFMYLILPPWFLKKSPSIATNLRENQKRLMSLFDIHATLADLLGVKLKTSKERKSPRGLSLFGEISKYRTCEMAYIMDHWCPCQVYEAVAPDDEIAMKAANALVKNMNNQLKAQHKLDVCASLKIEAITDVRVGKGNDMLLRYVKHGNVVLNKQIVYGDKAKSFMDFLITVRTSPGGGLFEGTVRRDEKGKFKVLGISRINKYGNESACIDSQILKKICFCK